MRAKTMMNWILLLAATAAGAVGLGSGTASAAETDYSPATVSPVNCPDGTGGQTYTYIGLVTTTSGNIYKYRSDGNNYFESDVYLGRSFVQDCQ